MAEHSKLWDGIAGDGGPYFASDMAHIFRVITGCTGNKGVLQHWLNDLEVTGNSSPISIDTGAAVIYGTFFESDEAVTLSVSTPASGTSRIDCIVVRRDYAARTARIARITGTASATAPTAPTLTQNATGIYEIPLAEALIDDAGIITITDTREYAPYSTDWPANSVTAGMYIEGAVTADKIATRTRYEAKGSGQLEPDATGPNFPTWSITVAPDPIYDYWNFATAVTNEAWVYFLVPHNYVGGTMAFYLWNAPDGAAAGNVEWEYDVYYGDGSGLALTNASGAQVVAQGARATANVYRDAFFTITTLVLTEGQIIALLVRRDGGGGVDTFGQDMRLIAVEMEWTADA